MFTYIVFTVLLATAFSGPMPDSEECRPRGPPPSDMKGQPPMCCKYPQQLVDKFKGYGEVCDKLIDKSSMQPGKPPKIEGFECLSDCILSQDNIYSDGKLNKETFTKVFGGLFEGEWADLASKVTDNCFQEVEAANGVSKCKSKSDILMKCFSREMFKDCPKASWTDSEDCTNIKAKLEKCPRMRVPSPLFPPKPPGPPGPPGPLGPPQQ